jgi:hypothetical protein
MNVNLDSHTLRNNTLDTWHHIWIQSVEMEVQPPSCHSTYDLFPYDQSPMDIKQERDLATLFTLNLAHHNLSLLDSCTWS